MACGPQQAPNVLTEHGRLTTFRNWPNSAVIEPKQLAHAGLYYLGQSDKVRCAFCGGTLKSWGPNDNPWIEHERNFPNCPFIQRRDVGNVPLVGEHEPVSQAVATTSQTLLNPCHPEYQTLESRQLSFSGWPADAAKKPEDLVEAGFFYVGHGDSVRCFCCDGALRNWSETDDAWIEHANWFSRCPYLLQQKGQNFVDRIRVRFPAERHCQASPIPGRRQSPELQNEAVQTLLDMGFDPQAIRQVVERLATTGQTLEPNQIINHLLSPINHATGEAASHRTLTEEPAFGVRYVESSCNREMAAPAAAHGERHLDIRSEVCVEDKTVCKICMEREVEVTFLPCGHLVCCSQCANQVQECPICRQAVRANIRTYLC